MTDLLPDTLYHYSVAGGADHTFRTSLPKGSPHNFQIYAEADIGDAIKFPRMAIVQC